MGVYTRKKDNKLFKTLDGKEIWVCDRCEIAFEGSEAFFNHLCDGGQLIYPRSKMQDRFVLKFRDLEKPESGGSEVTLRGDEKELVVYLRGWAASIEHMTKVTKKVE